MLTLDQKIRLEWLGQAGFIGGFELMSVSYLFDLFNCLLIDDIATNFHQLLRIFAQNSFLQSFQLLHLVSLSLDSGVLHATFL